jgi:uncharacterized membrane protein (UPF0136 family)
LGVPSSSVPPQPSSLQSRGVEVRYVVTTYNSVLTPLLIGSSWQYPWSSAATLVPLIIGVLGLVLTALYETYKAKHPFIRKALFHDTSSVVIYVSGVIQGVLVSWNPTVYRRNQANRLMPAVVWSYVLVRSSPLCCGESH